MLIYHVPELPVQVAPFDFTWLTLLQRLLTEGLPVGPRGTLTWELPQVTLTAALSRPVLTVPERRLSYRFLVAEAYWILNGDDQVSTIAPFNQHIAAFSDDGATFFGAYGPRFTDQLPGVVQKLMDDPSSRQAGLTLWRANPPATKDVPCTVAVFFQLRNDRLNVHVFMRSSDVWLGLPYDVFNFAMMGHYVAGFINQRRVGDAHRSGHPWLAASEPVSLVTPGTLFLTMASSHLYKANVEMARAIVEQPNIAARALAPSRQQLPVPELLARNPGRLLATLAAARHGSPGNARWWEARDDS